MARTQRISGNLTLDPTGSLIVSADTEITGNLTVVGTTTTITTVNTALQDRVIVLNNGEAGAGVTGRYSGIEVERGSVNNAFLVFDETDDDFKISIDGGGSYSQLMLNVVEDTTPQLGGDLDINGKNIVSTSTNQDIQLIPSGTGRVTVSGSLIVSVNTQIAGHLDKSISNSITAGSTQTQAGATALTADINRVTVSGTNGDGVALPTASAGREILIINDDSTQTIQIWPGSSFSDVIDGGSADAVDGNALAAGASRRYIAVDSTNWYTA